MTKKIGIIINCVLALIIVSCNTQKYDENISKAYVSAQICYKSAELIINNTTEVWRTAIFDDRDSHGNYCSNFSSAIHILFADYKEMGIFSTIDEYQEELQTSVASLSKVPKSRKEAYNDILKIAIDINMLCEMAKNPSGSLQSYRDQTNDLIFSLKKDLEAFNLKYKNFMVPSIIQESHNNSI